LPAPNLAIKALHRKIKIVAMREPHSVPPEARPALQPKLFLLRSE
jgi:hypothetical protein